MGAQGAVEIIFRQELSGLSDKEYEERKAGLVAEYSETFLNPWKAAELGFIDRVIEPARTREELGRAFQILRNKRASVPTRKHGNIPL